MYYVSIATFGSYEDKSFRVCYVGDNYEQAKEEGKNAMYCKDRFDRPELNGEFNGSFIQHWQDGKMIKEEDVF
jgi:hypothetical protein